MFVKNLPGQLRHCGSLLSHERSHNPDKETSGGAGGLMTGGGGGDGLSLALRHPHEYLCACLFTWRFEEVGGGRWAPSAPDEEEPCQSVANLEMISAPPLKDGVSVCSCPESPFVAVSSLANLAVAWLAALRSFSSGAEAAYQFPASAGFLLRDLGSRNPRRKSADWRRTFPVTWLILFPF